MDAVCNCNRHLRKVFGEGEGEGHGHGHGHGEGHGNNNNGGIYYYIISYFPH